MSGVAENKFPVSSLLPKQETGALNFLKKYPEFNGKSTTIAIFDSGVDPRSSGLQTLPDGSVKVLERFDCSGCGDVDTSKVVTVSSDGFITGLSGRKLKISNMMKSTNLGSEYHVGLKSLHDLYPSRVRDKIVAINKLKMWDEHHKKAIAEATRALDDYDAKHTNAQNIPLKDKLLKEDLDATMEFLNYYEKKFSDVKTSFDCVLYKTAECWMVAIDIEESGDLEKAVVVGEYTKTHTMVKLDDFFSISINVHDEGNALEIVGMCSSHGTHVASIASGYDETSSDLCGVAPGANIVSLTIGDGRLGSMETGTALVRAMIKVMELCNAGQKIDVINMSYGEHAAWSNSGRVGELMNEVVNKYGVVWVGSAGNNGPALCTIGTPPDISQPSLVGVGAYVSPEMMEAEYALRAKLPGNVYTWTSRDPCIDGGFGVTVCAPGAAIASVPEFTMSKAQLMNGTSMAAPNVAGSIALLISGLKQKSVNYTPYSIKSALWNTATRLDYVDIFAQGAGLLNVEKAFEHLTQYHDQPENQLRFGINVGNSCAKGIHMRQGVLKKAEEFNVSIEPVFFNEKLANPKDKISFNVRLTLVPTVNWVQCGTYLDLCYQSRSIVVRVDPTGLAPGVHKASVKAYDTQCIEKGVLFEIPVTVVQPYELTEDQNYIYAPLPVVCQPNTILRQFIVVPKNATWAVLEMSAVDPKDKVGGKFLVHTMQILPMVNCKAMETQKILPVNGNSVTTHTFKCVADNILEVCIAKYWSNFGEVTLQFKVKFHGIATKNECVMHSANAIHKIHVTTLSQEEVCPAISLKTAVMVLKPSETKITALTARDIIPPARQIYQNVLKYNLNLAKPQEVALYTPMLYKVLYEAEFESQFWMLFDSNKQMLHNGDAYSQNNYIKLEKGDYVIKLQVRHEKKEVLERVAEAVMLANIKLASALSLDVYKTYNQAITNGKKIASVQMPGAITRPIYIAPISNEKLTKAAFPAQCSWLEGTLSLAKEEAGRKIDTSVFQYILSEGPAVKKPSNGNNSNGKSKADEYKEGLRDYQNNMIPKLDLTQAEEIYKDIIANHPTFLAVHLSLIQNLDTSEIKTQLPFLFTQNLEAKNASGEAVVDIEVLATKLKRIIELADLVIKDTDKDALLAYYGLKSDSRPDAAKIKTNMDKQKQTLLDAYVKKIIALSKLQIIDNKNKVGDNEATSPEDFDSIYTEVGKFTDYTDAKVLNVSIWHGFVSKQYGRMTKFLHKLYDEKQQREVLEEIQIVVKQKQLDHLCKVLGKIIVTANPQTYRPF